VVLIVSNTCDPTADVVVHELQHRRSSFVRLNTDEYPTNIRGTLSIERSEVKQILCWDNRNQELDLSAVRSVWYRRPVRPTVAHKLSPELKKFAEDESYDFIRGLWYSLNCLWVSHPDSIRRAEHKTYQLTIAARLGLPIPRTLVTNDPHLVRDFEKTCLHGMIAKTVYMGFIDNPPRNIFTTIVDSNDIQDDGSIKVCPAIFQERINKVCDIRVTVIGEKVFAAEIRSDLPEGIPDWRAADPKTLVHCRHNLPLDIEMQCRALVKTLGLSFGAIDLGLDSRGAYTFFEINPNGQWAWLEPATGFPLTGALVDLLEEM